MKMADPLAYIIDTLVFDLSVPCEPLSDQTGPTRMRPWLIACMEPVSKRIMGSRICERPPSPEDIDAVLYEVFLGSDGDTASATVPDEIWFDAGRGMLSLPMQNLAQALHLTCRSVPLPPSGKWPMERFFATVQNACTPISTDRSSDTPECSVAEGALSELKARFTRFLTHYHHQVQSSTGLTPLESWLEQCHPSSIDPHVLFLLLRDGGKRRVMKNGIHYQGRVYWHTELARCIGNEVHIRVKPALPQPKTIEVFFKQQWLCSASVPEARKEDTLHETE